MSQNLGNGQQDNDDQERYAWPAQLTPMQQAAEFLRESVNYINTILAGQESMLIKMRIVNDLTKLGNYVSSFAGNHNNVGMVPSGGVEFNTSQAEGLQPLTKMFGHAINRKMPVTSQELRPSDIERNAFAENTRAMADAFVNQDTDQILDKLNAPGGEALIRAVAKQYGYEPYKSAPVNVLYIQDVKDLIQKEQLKDTLVATAQKEAAAVTETAKQDPDHKEEDDLQDDLSSMGLGAGIPNPFGGYVGAVKNEGDGEDLEGDATKPPTPDEIMAASGAGGLNTNTSNNNSPVNETVIEKATGRGRPAGSRNTGK